MAHPHNEHRAHKVEHRRLHLFRAAGGGVEDHEPVDELGKAVNREAKKERSQKAHGGEVKQRMDKRARGGRTRHKGKGKGHTTVNVVVPPHAAGGVPPPMPIVPPRPAVPAAPMMGSGSLPPGAPGQPIPGMPPGAAGPPMVRPGMVPPPMVRRRGGRIKSGPAWNEGLRAGTQVQHMPGKKDGENIRDWPPISYATGGAIEHPAKGGMAPYPGGGSGLGRLRKEHRAEKNYARPK